LGNAHIHEPLGEGLAFFNTRIVLHIVFTQSAAYVQTQLDWTGYADDIVFYLMALASLKNLLNDQHFGRYKLKTKMGNPFYSILKHVEIFESIGLIDQLNLKRSFSTAIFNRLSSD